MRQRAVRELRDRILTGALPAGSRLDLEAITDEFETSRTPVREALLQLSHEGLVRIAPRSGVVVIGVTPRDVLDSFSLLAALSGKAAEWVAQRHDGAGLDELRRLADAVADATDDGIVDANWSFHRALHRAAGSPQLLTLIRQAVRVVPSNYFYVFPDQGHHSQAEHDQLLRAVARRQGAKARVVAEGHVLAAGESLAEWLER